MSIEQSVEVRLVGVAQMVHSAQESEAGSEQVRLVGWGPQLRGAALQFPPSQGESFGEPASDVKAIEDVKSVGQILCDRCLIRAGPVGNDYLHPSAPLRSLIPEEPGEGRFRAAWDHPNTSPESPQATTVT